jgi:hypothetical protein
MLPSAASPLAPGRGAHVLRLGLRGLPVLGVIPRRIDGAGSPSYGAVRVHRQGIPR